MHSECVIILDCNSHLDCPLVCSDRGWCTRPSVWNRRGTRSTPGPSAHGGTAGPASATPDSKWHVADLSCGTPAAVRPENGGLSHSYWADPGSWVPAPDPPWLPFSFSVSSPKLPQPFLPISLLRPLASNPVVVWPPGQWRRKVRWRSWWTSSRPPAPSLLSDKVVNSDGEQSKLSRRRIFLSEIPHFHSDQVLWKTDNWKRGEKGEPWVRNVSFQNVFLSAEQLPSLQDQTSSLLCFCTSSDVLSGKSCDEAVTSATAVTATSVIGSGKRA